MIVTSITATPAPEPGVSDSKSADAVMAIQEIASEEGSGLRYVLGDAESEDERPRRRRLHLVHTPTRTNVIEPEIRSTNTSAVDVASTQTTLVDEGNAITKVSSTRISFLCE